MSNIFEEILDYRVDALRHGEDPKHIPLTWEQEERLRVRCEEIDAGMLGRLSEEKMLTTMVFGSRTIYGMKF